MRSGLVNDVVKTRPTLLLKDGRMLHAAMKRVRVTEDEVRGGTLDALQGVRGADNA